MIDHDRIIELRPGSGSDRRRFPRSDLARACKVRLPGCVSYRPAVTTDVSSGGVRLCVDGTDPLDLGGRVELAISWHGHPTVTHGETIPARVVRVEPGEDRMAIALAFETPIPLQTIIPTRRSA